MTSKTNVAHFLKKNLKTIIGVIITIILIYFIASHEDLDWNEFLAHIQNADYVLVFIGTIPFLLAHLFIAFRIQELLMANDFKKVKAFPLYKIVVMSVMLNNTLPARIGEIARAFFIVKTEKAPVGTAVATVVTERFFDFIIVVFSVLIPFLFFDLLKRFDEYAPIIYEKIPTMAGYPPSTLLIWPIYILIAVLLIGIVAILIFRKNHERFIDLLGKILFWLPKEHILFSKLRTLFADIKFFSHPRQLIKISFYTIIIWHLYGLNMYLLLQAFHIDVGYFNIMFIVGMVAVMIGVPSVPGAVGIYETAFAIGAILVGVDDFTKAFSCGLVLHVCQIAASILIGFIFFVTENVSIKEITGQKTSGE